MTRLDRFKTKMTEKGFDAAVISSAINQRYLTGFDYTDGYVLVTKNKSYVEASTSAQSRIINGTSHHAYSSVRTIILMHTDSHMYTRHWKSASSSVHLYLAQ